MSMGGDGAQVVVRHVGQQLGVAVVPAVAVDVAGVVHLGDARVRAEQPRRCQLEEDDQDGDGARQRWAPRARIRAPEAG
jgi:hypothetical protein